MDCKGCGKKFEKNAKFCKYCGTPAPAQQATEAGKKTLITEGGPGSKGFAEFLEEPVVPAAPEQTENPIYAKYLFGFIGPLELLMLSLFLVFFGQTLIYNKPAISGVHMSFFTMPAQAIYFISQPLGTFLASLRLQVDSLAVGLLFFAVGVAAFIGSHLLSNGFRSSGTITKKTEVILFSIIVAVGAFFRLYMIDKVPSGFFSDEAQNSLLALDIIKGRDIDGTKMPVFIQRESTNAAMLLYFLTVAFQFFGPGPTQARVVMAVIGILSVPAIYFFLRKSIGVRAALVGAFLFAVMRWEVNFSRILFHAGLAVFMVILAMYYMYKTYRDRNWADFMLFGLTTALTQYTYIPARFYVIVLVLFAIYILVREPLFYVQNVRKLALAVMVGFVAFSPMLNYIITHPKQFFGSRQETVVLNKRTLEGFYQGQHTLKSVLQMNSRLTFLMFHNRGDFNARHNLSGQPALDFVTGILAILGLTAALITIRRPASYLAVTSFIVFISGGILTIEAPQMLRTILTIPAIIIFCVLATECFFNYAAQQYGPKVKLAITIFICSILAYAGWENYNIYFNKQAKDRNCYFEFRTDEAEAANFLKKLGPNWHAIMIPNYNYSYTCRFMLANPDLSLKDPEPKILTTEPFEPAEDLPAKPQGDKNVVYILQRDYLPILPVMQKMYPKGEYVPVYNKYDPSFLMFFAFKITKEEVADYQNRMIKNGLNAKYFYGTDFKGQVAMTRVDPFIFFIWTVDPVGNKFSVEWTGKIKISTPGNYRFRTVSNDYSGVWVDGKRVLEGVGTKGGNDLAEGSISLAPGMHDFKVRYAESINFSRIELWWSTPDKPQMSAVTPDVLFPN